jgi:hypothetical protein
MNGVELLTVMSACMLESVDKIWKRLTIMHSCIMYIVPIISKCMDSFILMCKNILHEFVFATSLICPWLVLEGVL